MPHPESFRSRKFSLQRWSHAYSRGPPSWQQTTSKCHQYRQRRCKQEYAVIKRQIQLDRRINRERKKQHLKESIGPMAGQQPGCRPHKAQQKTLR